MRIETSKSRGFLGGGIALLVLAAALLIAPVSAQAGCNSEGYACPAGAVCNALLDACVVGAPADCTGNAAGDACNNSELGCCNSSPYGTFCTTDGVYQSCEAPSYSRGDCAGLAAALSYTNPGLEKGMDKASAAICENMQTQNGSDCTALNTALAEIADNHANANSDRDAILEFTSYMISEGCAL